MKTRTKTTKQTSVHHKKRQGHHQRRSKVFAHVYLPYLPMVLILFLSLIISGIRPQHGTLAYATNVSISSLAASTNAKRADDGKAALAINSKLNAAAQAKANDMVARNYWSHNTPEGKEPWVFIQNAGYSYLKAGENLAYGFATSDETVVGWMNSASHKANMLDGSFTEVGFGFANSSDFNNSGEETVVVAMYGKPQVLSSSTSAAPAAPKPTPQPVAAALAPTPAPVEETPAAPVKEPETAPVVVNTESKNTSEPPAQQITKAESLTGGRAPWIVFAVASMSGLAVLALLIKHSIRLRHLIRNSERFVLHHPLFDSTLISLAILGIVLAQTTGVIR
ncbi:MAG: hypothetical protein JWL85_927 [Candidatus Saccharibacteria bacterium]|nr:hypothetical protein [Candidatus Saccharibacteria bacterium]